MATTSPHDTWLPVFSSVPPPCDACADSVSCHSKLEVGQHRQEEHDGKRLGACSPRPPCPSDVSHPAGSFA